METIRPHLLDASALIKLLITETGSDFVRCIVSENNVLIATDQCICETIYVMNKRVGHIHTKNTIIDMIRDLPIIIEKTHTNSTIKQQKAREYSSKYPKLSNPDVMQLVEISSKYDEIYGDNSRVCFITADRALYKAAIKEGMNCKYCG